MAASKEERESVPVENSFLSQTKVTIGSETLPGNSSPSVNYPQKKRDPILRINVLKGTSQLLNVTCHNESEVTFSDMDMDPNSSIESMSSSVDEEEITIPVQTLQNIIARISVLEDKVKELGSKRELLTSSASLLEAKGESQTNQEKTSMTDFAVNTIKIVEGNIFEVESDMAIVHCVAKDFKMGDGIAKKIKERFRTPINEFKDQFKIGEVAVQEVEDRKILHMVTKEISDETPKWKNFKKAVHNLKTLCTVQNIKEIAMPKIGSGLDQLDWPRSLRLIKKIFSDSKIEVQVSVLKQRARRELSSDN